ncbi:glycosyltransferase family 87 protein [Tundrisphaera sp. TA3]|uniref:glycosyltransferase family 87 protein n=1 Tax=Tundrisphaera sp. TA3 TaxID=3435775 RepID=UPI003EB8A9E6
MKAWFRSRTRFERWFLFACCVFIPAELAAKAVSHTRNYGDFNVQRDFGMRFLRGVPLYENGNCFNYMPISAMYYAPMAMLPLPLASLARTGSALICLALSLRWLAEMTRDRARPGAWRGLTVAAIAIVLTSQYLLRDLDDGGPHLIYLALILGSLRCVQKGREGWGAAGFGLAIALKMTPGLFLPYFAWKRRWRLAGLTAGATAAWIVLPALWMGPASWWKYQGEWNAVAFNVFSDRVDKARADNEVRVQNQSLKPAVARLLVAYPPGHPLKLDNRADVAFANIRPEVANRVGTLAGLALLGSLALWSRRRFIGPDDPAWTIEVAALLIAMPLLSPVTWMQHLAFLLPAVYLLVAEHRAFRPLGRPALVALGLYGLATVGLNRGIIGREASLLLFSFHVHAWAMLVLLALLMRRRPTSTIATPATAPTPAPAVGATIRGPHVFGHQAPDRRGR